VAPGLLLSAWAMHFRQPDPPLYLGFLAFAAGKLPESQAYYALASGVLESLVDDGTRWHALPPVMSSLRRAAADALVQRGVVSEKLGRRDDAERFYAESLARAPSAQAHYNMAVLFWNRDWARAERELQEALSLDPGHAEAAKYLAALRARRR
jgi:tetratricopeptide (TPR) repeat protein